MSEQETSDATILIRPLDDADGPALHGLAGLDTARVPAAPLFGALRDGKLIAAVSVADGSAIADPFAPTADAVALLRVRAAQVNGNHRPARPARRWSPFGRHRRARAALAGSPPGGGGRLLEL